MHAALLALWVVSAPRATPEQRVFVLSLGSTGVEATLAKGLSEVFASTVRKLLPGTAVLGQDDVVRLLEVERQRDLFGCADNVSCLAEIAGALGADLFAVGSVGKVGAVYLLTLKLIRARDATTIAHVAERVAAEEDLIEATLQWGAQLVDPEQPAPVGFVEVGGEGDVTIDGEGHGAAPLHRVAVAAGVHTISWTTPVETTSRKVVVEPYRTSRLLGARDEPEERVVTRGQDARAGWYAAFGAGSYSILLQSSGPTLLGGLQAQVEGGYTLAEGWRLGLTAHMHDAEDPGLATSGWAAGVRLGPQSSARLTVSPTLALGVASLRSTGERTGLLEQSGTALYAETALAGRWGLLSNLSVGAEASYFVKPPSKNDNQREYLGHVGLAARVFVEGHAASDFDGVVYDGPGWWWAAWGVGLVAILAVNVFAGGDGGGDAQQLGTVLVAP
jgi:hypothetical protein